MGLITNILFPVDFSHSCIAMGSYVKRVPDHTRTLLNQAELTVAVTAKKPARIVLVDAAFALQESHLLFLRPIPAIVETLTSCADMYLHEEHGYRSAARTAMAGSTNPVKRALLQQNAG